MGEKYKDADWLREQYVDEYKSTYDMADECGVAPVTIRKYMDRHSIERRSRGTKPKKKASFGMSTLGYERWVGYSSNDGSEQERLYHHRLLAVAEYGFDAVCGMDVHHRNGIPWDNRPENIELMTRAEHTKHHSNGR